MQALVYEFSREPTYNRYIYICFHYIAFYARGPTLALVCACVCGEPQQQQLSRYTFPFGCIILYTWNSIPSWEFFLVSHSYAERITREIVIFCFFFLVPSFETCCISVSTESRRICEFKSANTVDRINVIRAEWNLAYEWYSVTERVYIYNI